VSGAVVEKMPGCREPFVALTFDDGPNPTTTPFILDVLAEKQAPATFFVLGWWADGYPDLVCRAMADGHGLGVHAWQHVDLTAESPDQIRDHLKRSVALLRALGAAPRLFRPPFGHWNETLVDTADELGLTTVKWSVDPKDWNDPSPEVIVERVCDAVEPGSIILLHDGGGRSATVAALPAIIDELRARGFTIVDLERQLTA
jgi:peptidoglycan/xylan/chitin deacetylase (PgdA/CDA1 family)